MSEGKAMVYLYGFSTLLEDKLENLIRIIENHVKQKRVLTFIFIHDAVIGTSLKTKVSNALKKLLQIPIRFYALIPDLMARGIDINNLREDIYGIEYDDLIDILASTPKIVSWI
ncbi:MAG: DsrH/TusB family sulfur metabolism protein [Candidatus Thorarchaeota archaeon]